MPILRRPKKASSLLLRYLLVSAFLCGVFYLPAFIVAAVRQIIVPEGQAALLVQASPIEIWWPQNNVHIGGSQQFKAILQNYSTDKYSLYWKVDDGAEVPMPDNSENYPHKEASVDVSGWNWRNGGAYKLSFIAKDKDGKSLAETSVSIFVDAPAKSAATPVAPLVVPTPVAIPVQSPSPAAPASAPIPTPTPATPTNTVTQQITVPVAQSVSASALQPNLPLNIWWPLDNTSVSGSQPLKAVVQGLDISSYRMYWQIDGGSLNELQNNSTDYPHKETQIDFSGWNWHGAGPYVITLVAKDMANNLLVAKSLTLFTPAAASASGSTASIAPASTVITTLPTVTIPTAPSPNIVVTNSSNPFKNAKLYVDPLSSAAKQATQWLTARSSDAAIMSKLASQPQASWFGNWNSNIYQDVRTYVTKVSSSGAMPVLVAYNIPQRDCGGYSSGGADSADSYKQWIQGVASGIGSKKAAVILEPDSLAQSSCLNGTDLARRYELLNFAVNALKANANTAVYLDAGHSGWVNAAEMASMLTKAGIAKADGFSLNVSNFVSTADNTSYGKQISTLTGNAHFVIDTSRNGVGDNGQWCNPSGRALGQAPTTNTGNSLIDAYLWIKTPGESDGNCNGGPNAGVWWPDYVLDMAKRAGW